MTLEQLKELLSTYGVNAEERGAPVLVSTSGPGTLIADMRWGPLARAEVDWTPDGGTVVRLQVEEQG